MNSRRMWVLESKGLLALEHCGFRKGCGTADHLVCFDSYIHNAFAEKELSLPSSLVWKKLITLWKLGILCNLYNLDFRDHLCTFIDGFLSHRLFQVRAGSTQSDTYKQKMGVPHGSSLSPVLFSLKINNIVESVLKGSETSLLIDDFALRIRAKSLPHAERLMQLCVNSVQEWVSNNGFKFSTSKTVCMHFCDQCKQFTKTSSMSEENPIKVVTEAKFLGVVFD